jgi:pantoate--beta-alanine ligase
MSSRNRYLSAQERKEAAVLYRSLQKIKSMVEAGERSASRIIVTMEKMISEKPTAQIDYIAAVDDQQLEPLEQLSGEVLIALAVRFGRARLIDNIILSV